MDWIGCGSAWKLLCGLDWIGLDWVNKLLFWIGLGQGKVAHVQLWSDHDLIDCCTFGVEAANDIQTVWVNTACRKDLSQKNPSKVILSYTNLYNEIASDVWETNNHVFQLMTENPQPVLVYVLIRSMFEHRVTEVPQGSQGRRSWRLGGPDPMKISRMGYNMFWLLP